MDVNSTAILVQFAFEEKYSIYVCSSFLVLVLFTLLFASLYRYIEFYRLGNGSSFLISPPLSVDPLVNNCFLIIHSSPSVYLSFTYLSLVIYLSNHFFFYFVFFTPLTFHRCTLCIRVRVLRAL